MLTPNSYRFITTILLASAFFVLSVSAMACPFFQYFATQTDPLYSAPATYTSLPTTAMEDVKASFVPSVSAIACPFFQYLATPLSSRTATYTSLPTTAMEVLHACVAPSTECYSLPVFPVFDYIMQTR